jgi:lipoate-protein ligase A
VATIDFLFQEQVAATRGSATDRYFLNSFHRAARPPRSSVLRAYTAAGDVVSVGRFHPVADPGSALERLEVRRRLSGGRALAFGDGFLGFSLCLPHRSALVADEPFALSPTQVPNRYARGVLSGLRGLGVEAFYLGRDFITVHRKVVGMVSFETDDRGALLFEGILALDRDFSLTGPFLARGDPRGLLKGEPLPPDAVTCLATEMKRRTSPKEIADALRTGFADHFRLETHPRDLAPLEEQAIAGIESREFGDGWLRCRGPRDDLPLRGSAAVPLGVFEVRLALEQERFVREVQLSGDFIANSSAVETLERELKLCPTDWRALAMVTDQVFQRPENFILGIGKLRTIPDTILKALPG